MIYVVKDGVHRLYPSNDIEAHCLHEEARFGMPHEKLRSCHFIKHKKFYDELKKKDRDTSKLKYKKRKVYLLLIDETSDKQLSNYINIIRQHRITYKRSRPKFEILFPNDPNEVYKCTRTVFGFY